MYCFKNKDIIKIEIVIKNKDIIKIRVRHKN